MGRCNTVVVEQNLCSDIGQLLTWANQPKYMVLSEFNRHLFDTIHHPEFISHKRSIEADLWQGIWRSCWCYHYFQEQ